MKTPLVLTAMLLTSVGSINAAEEEETLLNTLPFYKPASVPFSTGELTLPQLRNDGESLFQATIKFNWTSSECEITDAHEILRATETSSDEGFDPTVATQLQELLQQIVNKYKQPGAVIRVDMDGKSWRGVAGVSRYDNSSGNKPRVFSDKFRIGSITKMVMASLVLALEQDEFLSLDDTMEKWFSEESWYFKMPNGSLITVRDVLRHQTGLIDYVPLDSFLCAPLTPIREENLLISAFDTNSLTFTRNGVKTPRNDFKIGVDWEYSNTNYILVGMLIEKASKKAVADVLNHRLLFHLEAFNTVFPDDTAIPYYYSYGYTTITSCTRNSPDDQCVLLSSTAGSSDQCEKLTPPSGDFYDLTFFDPSLPWTAGAIISNVNDLSEILKGQATGTYPPLLPEL